MKKEEKTSHGQDLLGQPVKVCTTSLDLGELDTRWGSRNRYNPGKTPLESLCFYPIKFKISEAHIDIFELVNILYYSCLSYATVFSPGLWVKADGPI